MGDAEFPGSEPAHIGSSVESSRHSDPVSALDVWEEPSATSEAEHLLLLRRAEQNTTEEHDPASCQSHTQDTSPFEGWSLHPSGHPSIISRVIAPGYTDTGHLKRGTQTASNREEACSMREDSSVEAGEFDLQEAVDEEARASKLAAAAAAREEEEREAALAEVEELLQAYRLGLDHTWNKLQAIDEHVTDTEVQCSHFGSSFASRNCTGPPCQLGFFGCAASDPNYQQGFLGPPLKMRLHACRWLLLAHACHATHS